MERFVPLEFYGSRALIEVDEGVKKVGIKLLGKGDKWPKFEDAVETMKRSAQFLKECVNALAPSEVELTCGLKVGVEGGNTFWGFAKTSGEATYSVRLKWSSEKQK
jgi:hypothetical protein